MSRRALYERSEQHGWRELQRGVWALPGTRSTFEQQAWAAVLAVNGVAAVTGAAALRLRGILAMRPSAVTLLIRAERHRGAPQGVHIIRTRNFDNVGTATIEGLRVVAVERALADYARHLRPILLGRLMARACALRQTTIVALGNELEQRGRWPGRTTYRTSVAMITGELTHSSAEQEARRLLRNRRIALSPKPYPVLYGSRIISEIDLAVPDHRYGAEIDGPHHDLPEVAAADKQQDRQLRRLGWTIDRFPVELVMDHPGQFIREFEEGLARCQ